METMVGAILGAGAGYMLGDQKDAKKVAGREIWAVAGAVAGHLVQSQILEGSEGSKADPGLQEENERLRRENEAIRRQHHISHQRHTAHLEQLDRDLDELLSIYGVEDGAEEEAEAPPPPALRRVTRVGTAAPRATRQAAAPPPPTRQAAPAAPRRRQPLALPDYGSVEELARPREREYARAHHDSDADDIFGG